MKTSFVLGALTVAGLAGAAAACTLDDVKARSTLNCGVSTGLVGFALQMPAESGKALTLKCAALSRLRFLVMLAQ